jgi:hypothetical protein
MSNRLKAGIWYYWRSCLLILGAGAVGFLLAIIGISLFRKELPNSGGDLGLLQLAVLLIGYLATGMGTPKFLLQNGYTRRQIFSILAIALLLTAAALTGLMILEAGVDQVLHIEIFSNIENYRSYFQHPVTFYLATFVEYFLFTLLCAGIGFVYGALWIHLRMWQKLAFWLAIIFVLVLLTSYSGPLAPIFYTIGADLTGISAQGVNPWPYFLTLIVTTSLCFLGARQLLLHYQLKR